jgi:hypothetical protein
MSDLQFSLNLDDYLLLGALGPSTSHASGHANGNDTIIATDLTVWQTQYGVTLPLAATTLPEPTILALNLLACGTILSRRR